MARADGTSATASPLQLRLTAFAVELMERTKQHVREAADEEGISVAQLDVLRRLRSGPSPMRRLAEQMNCEASNLTGLVDRLEARGLVQRRPHPEDRRVRYVALTEAGEALSQLIWTEVAQRCELARLPGEAQGQLAGLLRDALS